MQRMLVALAAGALLLTAACGSGASGGGKGKAAAAVVPTTLPAGATLGCAQPPDPGCAYGGAASGPSGVKVEQINTKITPSMFQLQPPFAIVSDSSAPGGSYFALPSGTGSTSTPAGVATAAVNIATAGYYVIWAATKQGANAAGSTTDTSNDSFFIGFDGTLPTPDGDHTWSIKPGGQWQIHNSTGGCVQVIHSGKNDDPNGCDTWHLKKGIVQINLAGREDQSELAWLEVSPANPKQPMGDARG